MSLKILTAIEVRLEEAWRTPFRVRHTGSLAGRAVTAGAGAGRSSQRDGDDTLKWFRGRVLREKHGLAKECPESLQEKYLQMLLDDYFKKSSGEMNSPPKPPPPAAPPSASDEAEEASEEPVKEIETPSGQRDIVLTDLHLKAKKFLTEYSISLDDINQLFFIEGKEIKPLYDDLKTTKASETQVRIGLLQALLTGMTGGDFQLNGENVRTECQERKAYDKKNVSANFKNSASLFVGFDKYDKNSPVLRLTDAGKKRLADTIAELR